MAGICITLFTTKVQPFTATFILTIGWAGWHIPAFLYRPNYSHMNLAGLTGFFFSLFTGSIILTWLYKSSKGSILIVALFHTTIEMIFMSKNVTPLVSNIEGALVMIWALIILVIYKRHLSREFP